MVNPVFMQSESASVSNLNLVFFNLILTIVDCKQYTTIHECHMDVANLLLSSSGKTFINKGVSHCNVCPYLSFSAFFTLVLVEHCLLESRHHLTAVVITALRGLWQGRELHGHKYKSYAVWVSIHSYLQSKPLVPVHRSRPSVPVHLPPYP